MSAREGTGRRGLKGVGREGSERGVHSADSRGH